MEEKAKSEMIVARLKVLMRRDSGLSSDVGSVHHNM